MISFLCVFAQCRWQWVANVERGGLWQCPRCKTLSIGRRFGPPRNPTLTDADRLRNIDAALAKAGAPAPKTTP